MLQAPRPARANHQAGLDIVAARKLDQARANITGLLPLVYTNTPVTTVAYGTAKFTIKVTNTSNVKLTAVQVSGGDAQGKTQLVKALHREQAFEGVLKRFRLEQRPGEHELLLVAAG